MNLSKKDNNIFFWSFIIITILVGLYFRLKGLGKWPLAVDEYYIVKSSKNILKYGLPQWDAGGHYMRGLPQQYLTAFLLILGLKAEFASRIIPLLSNLLAIPGLYLLGKKISGKTLAAALVFIFTFSVWEVEFARFARMYTMFQTIFIWYLYFLYKNIIESDDKALKWLWMLSLTSIFVYEASIFLVILNFLPIIWDKSKNTFNPFSIEVYQGKVLKILICIGTLLIAYGFLTFDFRTLYQENSLPPDLVDYFKAIKSGGLLRKPVLVLQTLPSSPIWLLLFIIPLAINIFILYPIIKSETKLLTKIAMLILLLLSTLNLLGLIFISFLIFILIGWIEPKDFKIVGSRQLTIGNNRLAMGKWKILPSKLFRNFMLAATINFIFWIAFAIKTTAWYQFFPAQNISGSGAVIKTIVKESINYPYLYETYVLFRDTIPVITMISLLLLGILLLYIFINYYTINLIRYRFLFLLLLFLILVQNILKLTYFETRYFFFLYPLILLLALFSLERINNFIIKRDYLSKFAFGLSVIVFLMLSEDFNINHLKNIDSKEINFRMNFSLPLTEHYYPRWDVKTPAEVINKNAGLNDIVIINEQINDYYLNKLNYIYRDYHGADFPGESVDIGRMERWTGAKLIYDDKKLIDLLKKDDRIKWLLLNTIWSTRFLKADSFFVQFNKYAVYANDDSSAIVYKIPPNPL